MLKGRF